MQNVIRAAFIWVISTVGAWADGEATGDFDYYVLALSWSPNWCAVEGDARGSEQCDPSRDLGWVVHGLWPQYEDGWPSYCRHNFRNPSRGLTDAQADIFGAGGAAWYQWKKHGTCAGLEPQDYFDTVRKAYGAVVRPPVLRKLEKSVRLPAKVIEEAFLQSNPTWQANMLTITCKSDRIQEARLCLTRDLEPRKCGRDVSRDCSHPRALFDPVR